MKSILAFIAFILLAPIILPFLSIYALYLLFNDTTYGRDN